MRLRFIKKPQDYNDRTCIIVIDIHDISIGLIVDSVSEVLDIIEENTVPSPMISKDYHHRYIGLRQTSERQRDQYNIRE